MEITEVTVGLAVSDLVASRAWYERVLELGAPDLEPMEGLAEYKVGPIWLQLDEVDVTASSTMLRLGVVDIEVEHARLTALGVDVDEVIEIPELISYFNFRDPDGNEVSLYQVL
jgi:catechol 2,3-dioxygenase-like lactoylglutathione lyase family enzyme